MFVVTNKMRRNRNIELGYKRNQILKGAIILATLTASYVIGDRHARDKLYDVLRNPAAIRSEYKELTTPALADKLLEDLENRVIKVSRKKRESYGDWSEVTKETGRAISAYNNLIRLFWDGSEAADSLINNLFIDAFLKNGDNYFLVGAREHEILSREEQKGEKWGDSSFKVTYRTRTIGGVWKYSKPIELNGIDYTLGDLLNEENFK